MKTIKVNTWLPVFPGFYGTIFEPDESNEIYSINQEREEKGLNKISSDLIKFDYSEYNERVAKNCVNYIEKELKDLNVITSIEYQRVNSPKEYNFANDSIHISVEISDYNKKEIYAWLIQNIDSFEGYIKENYTSSSGFLSSYSNDHTEWLFDFNGTIEHEHKLGAVLNFICEMNEINDSGMLESAETYISAENYTDCTEKNYCVKCQSFKDNFEGNLCTDCFEEEQDELASGNISENTKFYCCKCKALIENKWANRSILWNIKLGNLKYSEVNCGDCL